MRWVQILQGCSNTVKGVNQTSQKWSGFPTSVSMSDGLMFKGLNVLLAYCLNIFFKVNVLEGAFYKQGKVEIF